ncbi:DHS-like NAD/FAD-binding domain-containing protein [Amniculicola lignicola CBS 123094]|uniref:DHS-like NAD/FAD-binding domain-containing protein n=1 Tax=Amniculicola lignicola CBS 123094 TaxID=1392246 RepID=A0A6A5WM38_9PLEO|nr:DHS-like NAD/FAD-binding domain-containing protein [Amniculicola lignicola CBS 123094]
MERDSSPLSSVPSSDSSDLSELSCSPSPPPEFAVLRLPRQSYPSPSSSQRSSAKTSPAPDMIASTPASSDDSSQPRKKRKLADPKERKMERLDLSTGDVSEDQQPQLDRLMKVLQKKRKIVVIAGAGISVSAGIPDFRSSAGLFSSLRKDHKLKSSGKELFDASVYRDDTSTSSFHDMVRSLSQKTKDAKPTAFHHLLATLAQEGRLLRLYSQNVDGIDTALPPLQTQVPLPTKGPWPKTVQLHGGLDHMVCSKCHTLSDFDAEKFNGPVPPACAECEGNDIARQAAERRSHGIGRLRPRMVLYNEHNPDDEAIGFCTTFDMRTRPDAVIVAGTTLKVPGVRRIAREMCAIVKDRRDGVTVWINNDPEPTGKDLADSWDIVVKGPCDEVARHAAMPRWDDPIEYKEVTDEQLNKTKEKLKASVVISSPRKQGSTVEQIQGQMLTPVQSPRIIPRGTTKVESVEQTTPSKRGQKRKSEPLSFSSLTTKEKAPPKRRKSQPKKATTSKAKPKIERRINEVGLFKQAKKVASGPANKKAAVAPPTKFVHYKSENQAPYQPSKKLESGSMFMNPVPVTPNAREKLTKVKMEYRHMMDLPVTDARNNPSPIRPEMESLTSPVRSRESSPYFSMDHSEALETIESRPSTASSMKMETIVPTSMPRDFRKLLDTIAS